MARNTRSVTTTEYALILAAIAVMVYGTFAYQIWVRLIGSEACPVEAVKNEAK